MKYPKGKSVGENLQQIMADLYPEYKDSIYFHFNEFLPSNLKDKVYIESTENSVLRLSVSHPCYRQLLQMQSRILLRNIQINFPELNIKTIQIS